jgi:hypothetical protein
MTFMFSRSTCIGAICCSVYRYCDYYREIWGCLYLQGGPTLPTSLVEMRVLCTYDVRVAVRLRGLSESSYNAYKSIVRPAEDI